MRGKEKKKKEEKEGESGISLLRTVSRKFSRENEERERERDKEIPVGCPLVGRYDLAKRMVSETGRRWICIQMDVNAMDDLRCKRGQLALTLSHIS